MMPVLTESSVRPACMPSKKEESFLPRIRPRGQLGSSSDSDSVIDYRRDRVGHTPASGATSVSSSPVKLPNIEKTKSNSIPSLPNGKSTNQARDEDRRSTLCRSPSCPSNIGQFWFDREDGMESPTRMRNGDSVRSTYNSSISKRDSGDLKLPDIFRDHTSVSGASRSTTRSTSTQRSPTRMMLGVESRDPSPFGFRRDASVFSKRECTRDVTSRNNIALDTHRSNTQSALLLPIRNSESRLSLKGKKKRRNNASRQNTQLSIQSDTVVYVENRENASIRESARRNKAESCSPSSPLQEDVADVVDDRLTAKVKEENFVASSKDGAYQGVKKPQKFQQPRVKEAGHLATERETAQVKA